MNANNKAEPANVKATGKPKSKKHKVVTNIMIAKNSDVIFLLF